MLFRRGTGVFAICQAGCVMGKLEPTCSEVIADLKVPASLAAILGPGLLAAGWFGRKFLGG